MKKNKFKKITAVFLSMLTVCSIISVPAYALSNSTLNTMNDAIEELESIGGNPHVEDHGLGGVYRCKVCGYIFDENREGRPFTTLSHCPICHVGQQQFEKIE